MITQINKLYNPPTPPVSVAEIKEHLHISTSAEDAYFLGLINVATGFFEGYTKREILAKKFLLEGTEWEIKLPLEIVRSKCFQIDSFTYLYDGSWSTLSTDNYLLSPQNKWGILCAKSDFAGQSLDDDASPNFKVTFWAGFNAKQIASAVMLSGTITITTTLDHNYLTGQKVVITGANESYFNGTFTITKTGAKTFTYTTTGANATATGEMMSNDIPEDIKECLKQIVAYLWASRGDCAGGGINFATIDLTDQTFPSAALAIMKQYRIYEIL